MERAVDRDQPQHDPVVQRPAAQRNLDLVSLRRVLAGRASVGIGSASQQSQRRQR